MSPPPSPFNVDLIKEAAQRERIAKERNVVENEGSMPRDVLNPWNILYAEGQGWTLWFQTEFKLRVSKKPWFEPRLPPALWTGRASLIKVVAGSGEGWLAHQLSFPRTFNLVIRRSVPISSGEGGEGRGQRAKGRKRPRCFDATTATAFVLRENAQPSRWPWALLVFVHAARLNRRYSYVVSRDFRGKNCIFSETFFIYIFCVLRLFDSRQFCLILSLIGEEGRWCKIYIRWI